VGFTTVTRPVSSFLNGTVVFFQDQPDRLVALVIGVGPLILFFGWLFFYAWLARTVDMTTHPFVRFPWRIGVVGLIAAAVLGRPGGCFLFFFVPLGAFFLSTHLGMSIRFLLGADVPVLPENYAFWWVSFRVGCYGYGLFCLGVLSGLIEHDFLVSPAGFVVLVQAAYGAYFAWSYLAGRFGWPTLLFFTDDDGVPTALLAASAAGGFFTKTGRGEITDAAITAAGVLGAGYLTYRHTIEKLTSQHDLEMTRLIYQHKTERLKLINDFDKYKLSYRKLKLEEANTMQRHFDQQGGELSSGERRFRRCSLPG
jgi:hypothetical protein